LHRREIGVQARFEFLSDGVAQQEFGHDGAMIYADCGVVIEPSAAELAEIAIAAADSCERCSERASRGAALVFDERKREAQADRQSCRSNEDGEGARAGVAGRWRASSRCGVDSHRRAIKSAGSPVAGRANVLIFPDLQAGNIAYKLTERLAGATAIGPILQGLDKPANDLSRGCTARDIVDAIAITAVRQGSQGLGVTVRHKRWSPLCVQFPFESSSALGCGGAPNFYVERV
jgi:phosphate acetyltransferase